MKVVLLLLCACLAAGAQAVDTPLASFTGTVKHLDSGTLTLARTDQDDLEVNCTHKTHYFAGTRKIKREAIKMGDRVSVETRLDLYLKPEAVNVRVLEPEKP